MSEIDDRLAGDPVWELFPDRSGGLGNASLFARIGRWLAIGCLVAAIWYFSPSLAVLTACLAVSLRDYRDGRQLARSIPDKSGAAVCARMAYAWGTWKLAITAFASIFVNMFLWLPSHPNSRDEPPGLLTGGLLCMGGYMMSAALTAAALIRAYRSGMRIWVGQGVNQARTLMLAMMIVAFTVAILTPMLLILTANFPGSESRDRSVGWILAITFAVTFGSSVFMLTILDWLDRHVVADSPAKFGPKVPTVGKWGS